LAGATPATLWAQSSTGTLYVTVHFESRPLAGAFVRSGRIGGVADSAGVARLELPGGLTRVTVTHPGFRPWSFEITIVADAPQRVDAALQPSQGEDESPAAVAPRSRWRLADEPVAAAVVDGRALAHATQLHPASLAKLLQSVPGVRAQQLSGPLGATRFRVRGLPGQYTALLADGLPTLGSLPNAFRPLELSPFDLARAELIPGPTAALYGPVALGGVLNLVSRPADRDTARLAVRQSSEKGGEVMVWGARRLSPVAGATLSLEFHQQRLVDADDDQWSEFPRAIRFAVRPRLFIERPQGDEVFATAGLVTEDRTGGFLLGPGNDDPYREERRTRRFDIGVRGRRATSHTGRLEVRFAGTLQSTAHRFDDLRENDRRSTLFGEVAYSDVRGAATVTAGIAYQRDALRPRDLSQFDYTYSAPSVFAHVGVAASATVSAALSGRCEYHNLYGLMCTPRISALFRPRPELQARIGLGAGYHAPTPLADDAEVLGYHGTVASGINLERGLGGSLDVEWHRGRFEASGFFSVTRIRSPARLIPFIGDPALRLRLVNVSEPTRVLAASLAAGYRVEPLVLELFYGYLNGSEGVPGGSGRRELGLTPRHTIGVDLIWEGPPNGTWAEVRAAFTGPQSVWDSPFRTRTPAYTVTDVLVSQPMGRARLYVSAENLFDLRQRQYEPILLPTPAEGGRRTTTPWVPLHGRVISLGAIVDW
jgi:iron complex outermembrane receptor protein